MTPLTATDLPDTFPWEDTEADVDPENWSPLDLVTPENLMRQLGSAMKRMDHIQAQAREMRYPIDLWEKQQLGPLMERAAYLDQSLQELGRRYRAADPRHNKTLTLPSGQVRTTTVNPKLEVVDEDAVIAWLEAYADENGKPVTEYLAVHVKPKLDPLKKLADILEGPEGLVAAAHGELIPGVIVKPGDVSVKVVPS